MEKNVLPGFYRWKFNFLKKNFNLSLNFNESLNFRILIYIDGKHFYTMYKRF